MRDYLHTLNYDFDEESIESLKLYFKYAKECGVIKDVKLRFFDDFERNAERDKWTWKQSREKFKLRETFKLNEVVQGAHVHEVLIKIATDSGIFFIRDW